MHESDRSPIKRIVVVDDDPEFVSLVEQVLTGIEGHEVLAPENWQAAHARARTERPDLIVLDVLIGRQEKGWAILEELLADPETKSIPIVLCSAAVESVRRRECALREAGVRAVLKPFDLEELLVAVRDALGQGQEAG